MIDQVKRLCDVPSIQPTKPDRRLPEEVRGSARSKAELLAEVAALRDILPSVDHDLVDQLKRAGRS